MRAKMSIWVMLGFGLVAGCKGYDSYDYLDGKFIAKNITPIDLLAPSDKSTSSTKNPKFTWTQRSGASKYLLEISTSSSFATLVLSKTTTDVTYTLVNSDLSGVTTLDTFSYYWRVTAIYSDQRVVSGNFIFHMLDDAIVYVDVSSTASEQVGNKGAPFKKIQAAIEAVDAARAANFAISRTIYVASGTYNEEVSMKPGISLLGGFEAQSWTRNIATNISTILAPSNTAVRANGAITLTYTDTTVINGFTITTGSFTSVTNGMDVTGAPTISGNIIYGGNSNITSGISISGGGRPKILNNVINGGTGSSSSTGIYMACSQVIITGNTINGGASPSTTSGLQILGSSNIITNNIIYTTSGATRYCLAEGPSGDPDSFQNNLLLDCPTALYRDEGTTNRILESDLNTSANTNQGGVTTTTGNIGPATVATLSSIFFQSANDFHLTVNTPVSITQGGKDTSANTCGSGGLSSCGNVMFDRDGRSRNLPHSMGAYEF